MSSTISLSHGDSALKRMIVTAMSIVLFVLAPPARVSADTPRIYAVSLNGVISSLSSDRVIRTIRAAEASQATAVLIEVDSPGGTESAVQEITRAVLAATVPVIVYVDHAQNADALSGAMFIALAANITAMSPDATLGAGNPESLTETTSTADQQDRLNQILQLATNTASARHRNVDALKTMIEKNANLTADQAKSEGLIDIVASSVDTLLAQVDGKEVQTLAGPTTIQSDSARILWQKTSWHDLILEKITDPNVAYILFSLGAMLLVVELFDPRRLIAGIFGIFALAAAFVAFGNMPVSWLGVGLMTTAFLLFIRALFTPKITFIGPIGVILYLVGSFTLYRPVRQTSAIVPAVGVAIWVIVVTTAMIVVVLLLMMRAIFRVRQGIAPPNASWLIGADGVVLQALQPRGVVRVRGQEWTAITTGKTAIEGDHVRVESINAGVLHVIPSSDIEQRSDHDGASMPAPGPMGGA